MRKLLFVLAICCVCVPAFSQDHLWELYGAAGYQRLDVSPDAKIVGLDHLNSKGFEGGVSEYVSRWFGGTIDANAMYSRPTINVAANAFGPDNPVQAVSADNLLNVNTYTISAGPTVAYRKNERFQPFAHVLLGAMIAHVSPTSKGTAAIAAAGLTGTPLTSSDTRWAYTVGGGSDFVVRQHLALRARADWVRSSFPDFVYRTGDDRQNHLKITFGVVYRWRGTL